MDSSFFLSIAMVAYKTVIFIWIVKRMRNIPLHIVPHSFPPNSLPFQGITYNCMRLNSWALKPLTLFYFFFFFFFFTVYVHLSINLLSVSFPLVHNTQMVLGNINTPQLHTDTIIHKVCYIKIQSGQDGTIAIDLNSNVSINNLYVLYI